MAVIDKATSQIITDLLWQYGVENIVVSPGSRCAPLTVNLYRSGKYRLTTIIDERSAAFVALGMARRSGRPLALVCTSGSAVLNYAPALAEAYYSNIPLIAISADRPVEMIDQLDSQTIRQTGALAAVTRMTADIDDRSDSSYLRYANRLINEALTAACLRPAKGPVHINMHFSAPLTPEGEKKYTGTKIDFIIPPAKHDFSEIIAAITPSSKVLVVAGMLNNPSDKLKKILQSGKFMVYAEAQSNLKIEQPDLDSIAQPDLLISIGGSLVSAKMKSRLRSFGGTEHISMGYYDNFMDTYGLLTQSIECEAEEFLEALAGHLSPQVAGKMPALHPALLLDTKIAGKKPALHPALHGSCEKVAGKMPALHWVCEEMAGADFHFSNGTAIRMAQSLNISGMVYSNRGVSGIEGSTSTAIGSAMVSPYPTVLITGDMSAAYDIGALAIHDIPSTFKMVVLDNHGGDIFRAVATTRDLPEREQFFAVPPQLPLEALAQAYGFSYCSTITEFINENSRPAILRLDIAPGTSSDILS